MIIRTCREAIAGTLKNILPAGMMVYKTSIARAQGGCLFKQHENRNNGGWKRP
jgi:hypothetical protein